MYKGEQERSPCFGTTSCMLGSAALHSSASCTCENGPKARILHPPSSSSPPRAPNRMPGVPFGLRRRRHGGGGAAVPTPAKAQSTPVSSFARNLHEPSEARWSKFRRVRATERGKRKIHLNEHVIFLCTVLAKTAALWLMHILASSHMDILASTA